MHGVVGMGIDSQDNKLPDVLLLFDIGAAFDVE